jgi:hypothetical protein
MSSDVTPSPKKIKIRIDDSDCDGMGGMTPLLQLDANGVIAATNDPVAAADPVVTAATAHATSSSAATNDPVAAADPVLTAATAHATSSSARIAMHTFFAGFKGCDPNNLEIEQVAAPDAALMDLRNLNSNLESAHVPANSDDTSGHTDSQSDDDDDEMSDFIDDTPIDLTPDELHFIAKYGAQEFPITAAELIVDNNVQNFTFGDANVLIFSPTRHRKRRIVSSDSSSSSSPTHSSQVADYLALKVAVPQ